MKRNLKYILVFIFAVLFVACSELKNNIPAAPEDKTHGEGVFDPSSSDFHGKLAADSQNGMASCQHCHAADYSGGIADVGCNSVGCHTSINVHVDGINDPANNDFHGSFIKGNMWDMTDCQTCHSSDYSGGFTSPSCVECHTSSDGPEACNTCHGNFDDISMIAPPRDLDKNTVTTSPGVGAHSIHLYENNLGMEIPCVTCHQVPQNVYDQGHVDSELPAEIIFTQLALVNNGVNSAYSYEQSTCSNTYCHGNFIYTKDSAPDSLKFAYESDQISGNNSSVVWNQVDGTQAPCGSCHGLPPEGHIMVSSTSCGRGGICHPGVVDFDGNISDPTKHINGEINVAGN